MRFATSFVLASLVAGCAVDKTPPTDSFTDLAGLDEKADAFSYRMKIVDSLAFGESTASVKYTKTPRFRAVKFAAKPGDSIDVWVRSTDGDAVAWVLDNAFRVMDTNDDADDTTLDAHISFKMPQGATSDTHYIVFRDYGLHTAHFTVALGGSAAACVVDADCAGVTSPDDRVPECNSGTNQCELVAPADIRCGGFTRNPHECTPGFACKVNQIPDIPGTCVQACIQRVLCTTTSHFDPIACMCVANT